MGRDQVPGVLIHIVMDQDRLHDAGQKTRFASLA
jgi:hypothetical protein